MPQLPLSCEARGEFPVQLQGLLRELSPGPLAPEARIMPLDQAAVLTSFHLGFHSWYDRAQHKSQHREARSLAFSCEVALAWAGGENKEKQRRERTKTHKTQPKERKRKKKRGKVCFPGDRATQSTPVGFEPAQGRRHATRSPSPKVDASTRSSPLSDAQEGLLWELSPGPLAP